MRGLDVLVAFWTDKEMISQEARSTHQYFQHVDYDAGSDETPVREKEFPPVPVVQEDVSEFDPADVFHARQYTKKTIAIQGNSCRRSRPNLIV